jgi:GTP cyclohydrolase I
MAVDRDAAARAIAAFLEALGHSPARSPELAGTPARVAEAFADDLLSGYGIDVRELLQTALCPVDGEVGPVAVRGIRVTAVCPHHLLPALGVAAVAYQPGGQVVGIGALSRMVDALSRRLVLQESIGQEVVQTLCNVAGARAALCRLELSHTCLAARGARQVDATVVTVARAGEGTELLDALLLGQAS